MDLDEHVGVEDELSVISENIGRRGEQVRHVKLGEEPESPKIHPQQRNAVIHQTPRLAEQRAVPSKDDRKIDAGRRRMLARHRLEFAGNNRALGEPLPEFGQNSPDLGSIVIRDKQDTPGHDKRVYRQVDAGRADLRRLDSTAMA